MDILTLCLTGSTLQLTSSLGLEVSSNPTTVGWGPNEVLGAADAEQALAQHWGAPALG